MGKGLMVLLMLAIPAAVDAQALRNADRIVMYTGAAFDIGSTWHATNNGMRESNPLVGHNKARQVAVVTGTTVAADWLALKLHSHRTLQQIIRFSIGGLHFGAGAYNIRVIGGSAYEVRVRKSNSNQDKSTRSSTSEMTHGGIDSSNAAIGFYLALERARELER